MDVYEDTRVAMDNRIEDLLSQMNVEEKAGLMFITMIGMDTDGGLSEMPTPSNPLSFFIETNSEMVAKKKMNHFNITQAPSAKAGGSYTAEWTPLIQGISFC